MAETYSYTVHSLAEYEQCQTGSRWKLQVNSFGDVVPPNQPTELHEQRRVCTSVRTSIVWASTPHAVLC